MFWFSTRPEGNILALSSRTLTFSLLPLNTPNKNTASAPLVVSHGIRYEGSASHACTGINSLGDGYEMHRPSLFFSLLSSRQLPGYKRSAVMHSKPSVSHWWLPHSPLGVLLVILSLSKRGYWVNISLCISSWTLIFGVFCLFCGLRCFLSLCKALVVLIVNLSPPCWVRKDTGSL